MCEIIFFHRGCIGDAAEIARREVIEFFKSTEERNSSIIPRRRVASKSAEMLGNSGPLGCKLHPELLTPELTKFSFSAHIIGRRDYDLAGDGESLTGVSQLTG